MYGHFEVLGFWFVEAEHFGRYGEDGVTCTM
jgi:hypothetical protein